MENSLLALTVGVAPDINEINATTLIGLSDGSVELTPDLLKDENFGKAYGCLTDVINTLVGLKKKADEEIKRVLAEEYDMGGDTTMVSGSRKYTYVPATTKVSIDTKRLQAELCDVYTKYSKISIVSPSLRVTTIASDDAASEEK